MPGGIGWPEIVLLLLVILLVFGPKRLPEMGRSMGKGIREFKESISGENRPDEPERTELEPPPEANVPTATAPSERESEHVSK